MLEVQIKQGVDALLAALHHYLERVTPILRSSPSGADLQSTYREAEAWKQRLSTLYELRQVYLLKLALLRRSEAAPPRGRRA